MKYLSVLTALAAAFTQLLNAQPVAKGQSDLATATQALEGQVLGHDDGISAGKRSIAGGGHIVKFESPSKGCTLVAVKIYGSRYGTPVPPTDNATIYLCDEYLKSLATFSVPYAKFTRGEPKWYTIPLTATNLPPHFVVCIAFNPAATKGVYVHHDAGTTGNSSVGLPGDKPARAFDKGDWMIRADVQPSPK